MAGQNAGLTKNILIGQPHESRDSNATIIVRNLIEASAAVLLVQTEVPFGVIFAYFMLREKPTLRALLGISVAFVGVYILTGSPNLDGKFIGIFLTILGSGIWALGQVMVKPLSKEINPIALVAWLALFSGPRLIFLSAMIDGNTIQNRRQRQLYIRKIVKLSTFTIKKF